MNNLTLSIINDGNGSICGESYYKRLEAITLGRNSHYWHSIASKCASWHKIHHNIISTPEDILTAALETYLYYKNGEE